MSYLHAKWPTFLYYQKENLNFLPCILMESWMPMKAILIYNLNLLCFKCYSEVMILCKISTGDGTSMSLYVNVIFLCVDNLCKISSSDQLPITLCCDTLSSCFNFLSVKLCINISSLCLLVNLFSQ